MLHGMWSRLLEALKPRRAPWVWAGLALIVTAYAGLLRYEALVANYGWMGQPRWSEALAQYAVPVARQLRPEHVTWGKTRDPYINGDPINYLRFAREMRHFYQAHVREPVFLAWTRAWLWLCGWRDVGLSFASAAGGTLAVLATFLLGAAAFSPLAGLLAALALAIEFTAITLSIDGWRDDTFTCVVALSAAAFAAMRRQPSRASAVLAGVAAAAACLTRITALSFVLPAMLWIGLEAPRAQRVVRWKTVGVAALVCAALLAPYLINCARATGDPLIAINYHTRYYRAAEGHSATESVSVAAYLRDKLTSRPITTIDTASQGLVTYPFENKWHGFVHWHERLPGVLAWLAAVGLVGAVFSADGRLLLVVLFSSLLPYAFTWSLGGGGEWRFTEHAYPFYLVFAAAVAVAAIRWMVAVVRRQPGWVVSPPRSTVLRLVGVVAALALAWAAYGALPWLTVREALLAGDEVNITAGHRDRWFFAGGWSPPVLGGVPYRVAQDELVGLRLPLVTGSEFWLTLRMDPAETADAGEQPRVAVFLNRRLLAHFDLTRDPARMGSYRIRVTNPDRRAIDRIDLLASHTVPARAAGPNYESLDPASPVAFRLWYVRIVPEVEP